MATDTMERDGMIEEPDGILNVWDLRVESYFSIVPDDEPILRAAKRRYKEDGQDSLVTVTHIDGSTLTLAASEIGPMGSTTRATRARARQFSQLDKQNARESGDWDGD